jgi:acetylornithine/succinyldiaminopimelate/putrescine aminotransferase
LVIPSGDRVIRFLPPLNVEVAEIHEAVEKFASVLKGVSAAS